MQHVVGHADALTLVVAADGLENHSLGLGVNGDEVVLVVHLDAIAIGNLGTLAGEKRHAENHRRVDEILEIDVGADGRRRAGLGGGGQRGARLMKYRTGWPIGVGRSVASDRWAP
jgi:hypothetical protein